MASPSAILRVASTLASSVISSIKIDGGNNIASHASQYKPLNERCTWMNFFPNGHRMIKDGDQWKSTPFDVTQGWFENQAKNFAFATPEYTLEKTKALVNDDFCLTLDFVTERLKRYTMPRIRKSNAPESTVQTILDWIRINSCPLIVCAQVRGILDRNATDDEVSAVKHGHDGDITLLKPLWLVKECSTNLCRRATLRSRRRPTGERKALPLWVAATLRLAG